MNIITKDSSESERTTFYMAWVVGLPTQFSFGGTKWNNHVQYKDVASGTLKHTFMGLLKMDSTDKRVGDMKFRLKPKTE